jgi:hypothetical protein
MSRSLARRGAYHLEGLSDEATLVSAQAVRTVRRATEKLLAAIERIEPETMQDCNALSLVIARTVDTLAKLQPREQAPTMEELQRTAESLQRASAEMLRRTAAIDVTPRT